MDPSELTYIGPREDPSERGVHRRLRFRLGGQDIDAVVTDATAQVWRQAHPGAGDEELEGWAVEHGRAAILARLQSEPLNVGDVYLERSVGPDEAPEERPRYGEDGLIHR